MILRAMVAVLAGSFVLSGCISLAPEREAPELLSRVPESYGDADIAGPYAPAAWWTAFEDPVLDSLVIDALRDNLDIAEAAARVREANARARLARAGLFPSVDASAGASYSSSPIGGSAFGEFGGGQIDRIENETYTLGLGAAYELDLFGRVRNDLAAARRDADAARHDFQAVQIAAASETISAYFELVDTIRQIALTEASAAILADRAQRTDERFRRGVVESFELYQVRQELRAAQASLPQLESQRAAAQGRLALLVRAYPDALSARLAEPLRPRLVFDPVPAGLPAALLAQRPDIAASWSRFDAARLRIGARRAERFPRLTLNGSYGTQADSPGGAFDFAENWTRSLAANLVAPIFDAGRIAANVKAARAAYDAQAAVYARTVLNAFREVDAAIADYEQQRRRYRLIAGQLDAARASLDLQERRFAAGVGSYVNYLDALRAVYQVEANLSSAARATALARLGVHRALGGDWSGAVTPEPIAMQPADTRQEAPGPAGDNP